MIQKIKSILFADDKSARVWVTGFIIAAGTLAGILSCLIYVYILHKPLYPYGTIFNPWPDTFADFMFTMQPVLGTMEPYRYLGYNYFPFTYVLLFPLRIFPAQTGLFAFLFAFIAFFLCYAKKSFRGIKAEGWAAIIFTFLSYPVYFAVERGNIEMLMFVFLVCFIYLFRKKFFYAAALILALLISLKLYPAVFLILFAKDKKFKPLFIAVAGSIVLFLTGMSLTGNDYAGLARNLAYFNERYAVSASGVGMGHSLFAAIRAPMTVMLDNGTMAFDLYKHISAAISLPYMVLSFVFFAAASLIVIFKEKSFWKNIFILTACSVWLPYVSYDYTLLNLFAPFMLFVCAEDKEPCTLLYSVLFGLIFIPMNWVWLCGSEYWRTNIGSVIRPILLGFMLLHIMFKNFNQKDFLQNFKNYFSAAQ